MIQIALAAGILLAQDPATPVSYAVRIAATGERPSVSVELRLTGEEDGTTRLRIPAFWGGQSDLWNVIDGLTVNGGDLSETDDPGFRDIAHAPGAPLTIRYSVVPDRTGAPNAEPRDYYRPYIEPDFIHLIGHTVFIIPDIDSDTPISLRIDYPDGWAFASDLEHGEMTLHALTTSVTVAGDYRVETREVGGANVRIAQRGDTGIPDDVFAEAIETAILANLDYWQAEGEPYLVTVLTLESEPDHMSIGGTNLGDSFAMFVTAGPDISILTRILAHEHTHTWVPDRLGGALPGDQYDEAEGYWFSEGFTDFLTTRAGVRGGSFDAATAIAHLNEVLAQDAASPWRGAPNSVIREQFWADAQAQRLPYHRGELFAALVDHEIRTATNGAQDLDDVITAMAETRDEGPASARFADVVLAITGVDVSGLVERHIVNGEPVFLAADTFGTCGPVETEEAPVFVYGMTGSRNEAGQFVIETVDETGPAWPAGFRPGMTIIERLEGSVGDASVDSVLRVENEDGIQDLRYRPTNGEIRRTQRLVPNTGGDLTAACHARLAGEDA
ncbi:MULTISPECIES: M61 family metallopeptidase [Hyphobacterium]|uniref:Peptidase M61 catalytic domain-containing protein n=1 Tax=Hyphobacterium vulgare TaxID=1736751 RepID=A0ABV6ZWF0_9PROT